MLEWLDPSQLICCDTDSVIFLYNKTNPLRVYPSNEAKDLPKTERFGDALGEWEDEFKGGEYSKEVVIGGAQSSKYVQTLAR